MRGEMDVLNLPPYDWEQSKVIAADVVKLLGDFVREKTDDIESVEYGESVENLRRAYGAMIVIEGLLEEFKGSEENGAVKAYYFLEDF